MAIQVSIISAKLGSVPPAAAGFRCRMSPESHIAPTIAGVSVRASSEAAASATTTGATEATSSGPSGT